MKLLLARLLNLRAEGEAMVAVSRIRREEKGAVDLAGIMVMGLGFVFIAVGFIVFQIFMDAAEAILDWTCTANATYSDASFTGFTEIIGITPLLVLVGFLAAGVFAMYLGVKISKGEADTKMDLGTLILLALAIIFLAVALIILPVTLEAICSTLSNDGAGISSSFTGVGDMLLMSPLLLIVALIGGAIVTGFFGMKRMGGD